KVEAILAPVEEPEMLAEEFGGAVEEGGALQGGIVDRAVPHAEAVGGQAAGKEDLRHVEQPGRLEYVESAQGVDADCGRGVSFAREREHPAEMIDHRRFGPLDCVQHVAEGS